MNAIELVASVSNKEVLDGVDTGYFDSIYLGQPYCLKFKGNFLANPKDIEAAVVRLKDVGKKAYLTTPAIPKGKDLPRVVRAIEAAVRAGIDGIEVHDVGVFRTVRNDWPDVRVHVGNFVNVYNEKSAGLYHRLGAARIVPSHELAGDELAIVTQTRGAEFERPIHGPLPLGMAYACLLRKEDDGEELGPCEQQCSDDRYLELDGWRMRTVGTSLLVGEEYSLIEHLVSLMSLNLAAFRLETYFDTAEKINILGKIYRQVIERAVTGRGPGIEQVTAVKELAGGRLCNGWHFGRSGRDYVGADEACV